MNAAREMLKVGLSIIYTPLRSILYKYRNLVKVIICLSLLGALSIISIYIGVNQPLIMLDNSQNDDVYSCSAQILIGLFGLLVTGYIFSTSLLKNQLEIDNSLEYIQSELQQDLFFDFVFLSVMTLITTFLCLGVILFFTSENILLLVILLNITGSFIVIDLLYILKLFMRLIKPNILKEFQEKGSLQYYQRDETADNFFSYYRDGNIQGLKDFLSAINSIYRSVKYFKGKINIDVTDKKIPFQRVIKIMSNLNIIDSNMSNDILEVIKYSNYILCDNTKYISMSIVTKAITVAKQLDERVRKV